MAEAGPAPLAALCIGDPDQAVYGFRGSDRELFFRLRDEMSDSAFTLTRTYRSTETIVQAAGALLAGNSEARTAFIAVRPPGPPVRLYEATDPSDEGDFISETIRRLVGGVDSVSADSARDEAGEYSFADIAVLFRTRAIRDALLPSLLHAGLPVTLADAAPFHAEKPFSSLIAALRFVHNPRDIAAFARLCEHLDPGWRSRTRRIRGSIGTAEEEISAILASEAGMNTEPRERLQSVTARREELLGMLASGGIDAVIEDLLTRVLSIDRSEPETLLREENIRLAAREFGADLEGFLRGLSLLAVESEGALPAEKVRTLTFHASKGLEFPVVFIAGAEEGITPLPDNLDEERRLFYVAMTRARDSLFITSCTRRSVYGVWKEAAPSRFLADLPARCVERVSRRKRARPKDGQLNLFG
jgi:superfamily I DNA/RNA helicase